MKHFKMSMLLVIAAIVSGAGVAGAASEVVILKFSHFLPSSTNQHKYLFIPWCDKINKESGGRLKCQIYPSMQLGGTANQLFDQVRDGVADIVWTLPTYQAGRFTKSEVFELPFMIKTSEGGSQALWDYVHKYSMDEFRGFKLIATHVSDGTQLHLGGRPVKTLEDLKGLKIRATSRLNAKTLAALGAIPVQMPITAVSEAISKGVVDGASVPWDITMAFKLEEICKTHTETAPNQAKHGNSIFVWAMNQAKYNKLPPELKKVIDNNSGIETSKWVGRTYADWTAIPRGIALSRHNSINILTDTEFKRWVKATDRVDDEWINEVNAKGGNGKELLNSAKALLKKYDR